MNTSKIGGKPPQLLFTFTFLIAPVLFLLCPSDSYGQLVRSFGVGGTNEFSTPANWTGDGGVMNAVPGYQVDSGAGEITNAIIQGIQTANLTSNFTAANQFDILIVRGGATLNISADLDTTSSPIGLNNTVGTINQTAGTVTASQLDITSPNGTATYTMSGGAMNLATNLLVTDTGMNGNSFSLQGSTATVTTGGDLTIDAFATLNLVFGPSGINPISVGGTFYLDPAATMNVDGSAYTGAAGTIDLVNFNTGSVALGSIAVTGFNPASFASSTVGLGPNSLFLNLVAPTPPVVPGQPSQPNPNPTPSTLLVDLGAITQLEASAIPMNVSLGQVAAQIHNLGGRSLNRRIERLRTRSSRSSRGFGNRRSWGVDSSASHVRDGSSELRVQNRIDLTPDFSSRNGEEITDPKSYSLASILGTWGAGTTQQAAGNADQNVVVAGNKWEVFASADYGKYELDQLSNSPGVDSTTYASTVGFEYRLSPAVAIGLGWSHVWNENELQNQLGSVDVEGNAILTYASFFEGNFWGDVFYSYGDYSADVMRNTLLGTTAQANPDVQSHQTTLNLGYNLQHEDSQVIHGPVFRADYNWGKIDGYTESGDPRANTTFGDQDYESFITTLGWQVNWARETDWGLVRPSVRLGYGRENLDSETNVNGTLQNSPINLVQGNTVTPGASVSRGSTRQAPGENWMEFGAGLGFELREGFSIFLDYQGRFFQEDATLHLGTLKASWEF